MYLCSDFHYHFYSYKYNNCVLEFLLHFRYLRITFKPKDNIEMISLIALRALAYIRNQQ